MSNCGDKNTSVLPSVKTPIPGIKDVDIILGELSASAVSTNRNYAAFKLSLERGKNADVAQVGQAAIYFIGGICCLLPEVADDVLEGLRQKGGRCKRYPIYLENIFYDLSSSVLGMYSYGITYELCIYKSSCIVLKII